MARDRQTEIALRYREGLVQENEQIVLSIVEPLLTLVKLRVVGIVVFRVLAPPEGCVVCSRSSGSKTAISVKAQTVELRNHTGVSVPVEGQLGSAVEAIAVVVGSPSQCPYGLVEVLEHFPPVLERTSFVLTSRSLSFPLSFSSPSFSSRLLAHRCVMSPPAMPAVRVPATPMPATTGGTQSGVVLTLP